MGSRAGRVVTGQIMLHAAVSESRILSCVEVIVGSGDIPL